MAGLGRKVFTAGEVLTAANVQGYLMDQSVMVFDSSAARSSAIGTPTEGMASYLKDTNALELYDGAAWNNVVPTPDVPQLQTIGSATYTVLSSDAGDTLVFTAATATVTVSTATAFVSGDRIDIVRDSSGSLTLTAAAGVVMAGKGTLGTANSFTLDAQYEAASLLCTGSNAYRVIGAVSAV